jgi:hypothetical protein
MSTRQVFNSEAKIKIRVTGRIAGRKFLLIAAWKTANVSNQHSPILTKPSWMGQATRNGVRGSSK